MFTDGQTNYRREEKNAEIKNAELQAKIRYSWKEHKYFVGVNTAGLLNANSGNDLPVFDLTYVSPKSAYLTNDATIVNFTAMTLAPYMLTARLMPQLAESNLASASPSNLVTMGMTI